MTPLFDSAPGFDQPLAVLKHCHTRIRKQLSTLSKLPAHLQKNGADIEAQQAAFAVIRYFTQGAPNHHLDEEHDLIPMLTGCAQGDDANLLQQLLPEILKEHQQMDAIWQELLPQLNVIQQGVIAQLNEELIKQWSTLYLAHMDKEEQHIAPMAMRLFSSEQMQQLGNAMQARRLTI
ncbi:hemerythrin domain-containing protein [Solimicrobium silvestre]|uniref:Hemerythrin HHE cation binding domain n=1 Tax=Solimicrobium silvestre TaxID=2099400 RepID=A0A2S9H4D1_9BURK|nr:hemerythrin domain-containing protein [Solimicrobium silvestre]PRC94850.1 Hemerythrin HHE cation binding domain [Solimicrobium silvestre]